MWLIILKAIYFFLPAGAAGFWPPIWLKVPGLKKMNWPMDFGLTFRGKRIFGAHKTWRGFISGVVFGVVTCWIQRLLMDVEFFRNISKVDYNEINIFWLGALLGGGAMLGDAIKSFFKRRVGVPPGKSWFPWDQADYIIGGLAFSLILVRLEWWFYVLVLVFYFILHLMTKVVGYWVKVNDDYI